MKINLRAKKEHVLILKYDNKEKVISVDGKIDLFILFLDTITGLYPAFIDAHTENWYYYEHINFMIEEN